MRERPCARIVASVEFEAASSAARRRQTLTTLEIFMIHPLRGARPVANVRYEAAYAGPADAEPRGHHEPGICLRSL